MSAVRRNDRRANRNILASPYARPSKAHPSKKSLWSLSGLMSFLNPFGGNSESEDSDFSGPSDGEIEQGPPPRRFSPPPQQPLPPPPPPPQQQFSSDLSRPFMGNGPTTDLSHIVNSPPNPSFHLNVPSHASTSSSPSLAKNLEPVTRFLVEKAGQPLNEFEAAGIVDYIQKSVQGPTLVPEKPEPFRFSVSPSRSASPNQSQGAEAPRKTLPRNPNGVYRWQGAGSSRPRNRYQSPGFTPRPQQHRIKLSPPKTPLTTDMKRRRVGDEAESLTPQKPSTSTIRFPSLVPESPNPPSQHSSDSCGALLNGKTAVSPLVAPVQPVTPKAAISQARLRTTGLAMKPTTPAIPSPLRQTWKESDSPPQASPPSRPTRAADFMTELIKEVTPTKKPDVSNPYQTASPVKPPAPVRKSVIKRSRHTAKFAETPKVQEPEISAQAIIEATIPKGTKRSRPPTDAKKLEHEEEISGGGYHPSQVNSSPSAVNPTSDGVEIIAIMEDEEVPSKRRKTPPIRLSPQARGVGEGSISEAVVRPAEAIEPVDVDMHINGKSTQPTPPTQSPSAVTKSVFGGLKTSAPKEPSKLRYSFQADKVEVKNAEATSLPPPVFALPSTQVPPITLTVVAPGKAKLSAKEEALAISVDQLPKYTFSVPTNFSPPAGPSSSTARNSVLALAITALPVYEFSARVGSVRAINGFNWTAAGKKAPTTSAQMWMCSLCGLQNPADAKEKCTICDAHRQAPADSSPSAATSVSTFPAPVVSSTASSKSFDWSAAGVSQPSKLEGGAWMCSTCSLTNPASATDKCTICDMPR